jgi:hypothetical protein
MQSHSLCPAQVLFNVAGRKIISLRRFTMTNECDLPGHGPAQARSELAEHIVNCAA